MSSNQHQQFKRKAGLALQRRHVIGNNPSAFVPGEIMDLSEFQFTFSTSQQDVETPNSAAIRVYNLSRETAIGLQKSHYDKVSLQAGYEGAYGVIFEGNIKQYRLGKENATTTFVEILAADGDLAYNYAVVRQTVAAGSTPDVRINASLAAMAPYGVAAGEIMQFSGGVLPRGKVLFSPAPGLIRNEAQYQSATWNISNGFVNVTPLNGYLPGEAIEINALTGLIGIPEQTEQGLIVRCLLNPKISVGSLVRINNKDVNQIMQAGPDVAPVRYNSYVGTQFLAHITADGLYRVFVASHTGDTRGQPWYTDLVCLAIDPSTDKVLVP